MKLIMDISPLCVVLNPGMRFALSGRLLTAAPLNLPIDQNCLHRAMNKPGSPKDKWDESTSALAAAVGQTRPVFDTFFERSADAMWLVDHDQAVIVDCNRAAVQLI